MDKLVDVFAVVEHGDVLALVNPLEKNLEDSQPPVAHDGTGTDDRDIQTSCGVIGTQ